MTITVSNGSTPAASIAGKSNSAAAHQSGGGANSLFAMLFSDAQLGTGLGALLGDDKPSLSDRLNDLLASKEGLLDPHAQLAAFNNPRLAAETTTTDIIDTDTSNLVDDLLTQIHVLSKDSDETGLLAEASSTDGTPVLAQLDPSMLGKASTPLTDKSDSEADSLGDVLSGKKAPSLLGSLVAEASSELAGEDALKNASTEKVSGNEFSHQLSQALNGTRRPDGESAQPRPIQAPIHDQQAWPKQLGDRVVWMTQQGQQTAEIHLNPAQLGPLQITLNLSHENATAVFVSQHAEVRQALQDALPQLREMLASAGINLGQANVSDQGAKQQQYTEHNTGQSASQRRAELDTAILRDGATTHTASNVTAIRRDNRTIDLFA